MTPPTCIIEPSHEASARYDAHQAAWARALELRGVPAGVEIPSAAADLCAAAIQITPRWRWPAAILQPDGEAMLAEARRLIDAVVRERAAMERRAA